MTLEEEAMDKEQQIDAVLPHLDEWMNRVLGGFPETADKAYAAAKVARRGIQKDRQGSVRRAGQSHCSIGGG